MFSKIKSFENHKVNLVTILSDDYESMKSTLEILSDPELVQQIQESGDDFKAGRYKELHELMDEK